MSIDTKRVAAVLAQAADILIEAKDVLEQLDSASGDGDLGLSMEKGSHAVKSVLAESGSGEDIGDLLIRVALAFNKGAPSTMGTLLASALVAAGKETKGQSMLTDEEVVRLVATMTRSIKERGKADLGDKTILDAMIPMSGALSEGFARGLGLKEAISAAADAAEAGAESTKNMVAKAGRAKWIGERTKSFPDGGAVLCSIVMKSLTRPT